MNLRAYQEAAKTAVLSQWEKGTTKTLLVMATGTGKTIVFSAITADIVSNGGRVLILAHREELLNQAADKLFWSTGLVSEIEKAEHTCLGSWHTCVVGSVQTLQRENRLVKFERNHFTHIIVDEAHRVLAEGYQDVLNYFNCAKVLGVTATADRGDKRNLGEFFETVAFEYQLPRAIREGFLCRIVAQTIPLKIDLDGVKQQQGDFAASGVASALDPYLHQIADAIKELANNRKTVVFLPLVATSQKFCEILNTKGIEAREVNCNSDDRRGELEWFHNSKPGVVLCNAMLLTEGWDQPDVDCVVVLRPTKTRSLYCQMVGRGTRLHPGKENLLLLDFLWHSETHDLCRPTHLICQNPEITRRVAELASADSLAAQVDILDETEAAENSVAEEREESLKRKLEEQRHKKRTLVDPLQYEMSIHQESYLPPAEDLRMWAPTTDKQKAALESAGINPDDVTCQGHASKILETIAKRRTNGMTTPKQIRCLERYGFKDVGTWEFTQAKNMIDRIAGNAWSLPRGVRPFEYKPETIAEVSW